MLNEIKLKNFRSFDEKTISFQDGINFIVWENWKWKSNILEAISIVTNGESMNSIPFENMVKKDSKENLFFLQGEFFSVGIPVSVTIWYDKITNKKKFFINKKAVSRARIIDDSNPAIIFSPMVMNMMYMDPKWRRQFIDSIIWKVYPNYKSTYRKYEEVVRNRNKVLKNIKEWNSNKYEINFWNEQFLKLSEEIYEYRIEINSFIEKNITKYSQYFLWKIWKISYKYITKVDFGDIKNSLLNYLEENLDRDIILCRTPIWPHVDDFDIEIDWVSLINFASRWEVKSVVLSLKFMELDFIKMKTHKKPILIIDDLLSELDEKHIDLLINEIKNYQSIISNILPLNKEKINTIHL